MPAHDDGAACADDRRTKTSKGGNRGKVTWREWRALHAPATRKGNVIHSPARKDSGRSASPMAIDIDQFGLRSACLFPGPFLSKDRHAHSPQAGGAHAARGATPRVGRARANRARGRRRAWHQAAHLANPTAKLRAV